MHRCFEAHRATLDGALRAAAQRTYWSAAPETPSGKIYGETAKADAEAAFKAQVGKPFEMDHPGSTRLGNEESPWGFPLGVTYPSASIDELVAASRAAGAGWAAAGIEARAGVCLEIIHRLNKQSFAIANAVQHTSGQPFVMAFQAGGPHAQDRALEAVAYAYGEMTKVPAKARWEKPQGGGQEPLRMDKQWRIVPRGIAVTIGCSTFPTWNSYPGMFASLATGNTVIVKPHPAAILPLAVTVRICRDVLKETGFDPNVVLLAVDEVSAPITKELVTHPDIAIVDFTGSPAFGRWVRENAKGAQIYTEEAGVNSIVIDSTSNFKGMCGNIAFSLVLYSGQMCTAPQNIFVPRDGIDSDEGRKSFDDVARGIAGAVEKLIGNPERAAALLGTIQSEATAARVKSVSGTVKPLLASKSYEIAGSPGARTATPAIFVVDAAAKAKQFATRLVEDDKVVAQVGGSTTGDTMAMCPVFEEAKLPLISLAGAVIIIDPVKKFCFKTPHTDKMACEKIFEDMKARGLTKIGMISGQDAFGKSMQEECKKVVGRYGIEILADETYGPRDTDMTPQLTNIKAKAGLQAVLNAGFGQGPAIVTRNFKQLGFSVPLYQSHGVASKGFIDAAGDAAEGVRLPAAALLIANKLPDNDPQKQVVVRYTKDFVAYAKQPVSTFGGHAYDGLTILVEAIKRAKSTDGEKVRDEIEKTKGFIGTGGVVNMSPTDHMGLDLSAFRMLVIKNGDWAVLQ